MIAFIAVPNAPSPRRAHVEYKGRRPKTARIAASLSISPALGGGAAASSLAAAARAQGMTADRDRFVDRGRDTDRVVEFQRSVDGARVVCEVRTSRRRLAVVVRFMTDRGPRDVDVVGRAFRISIDRRRPVRPRATAAMRVAAAGRCWCAKPVTERWP